MKPWVCLLWFGSVCSVSISEELATNSSVVIVKLRNHIFLQRPTYNGRTSFFLDKWCFVSSVSAFWAFQIETRTKKQIHFRKYADRAIYEKQRKACRNPDVQKK